MPVPPRATSAVASLALVACLGCGPDNAVSDIQQSPEAINADEAGRKAMQEYMQGKTKTKSKTKSASAGGGNVAPR